MGLFNKREPLPQTAEERAGDWTRAALMQHWKTIPDRMKVAAFMSATEDQLRVMGWDLSDPADRFLAISEAKQRRAHPELRRKIEEEGGIEGEDMQTWIAPLQEMHGGKLHKDVIDQKYREVFGQE